MAWTAYVGIRAGKIYYKISEMSEPRQLRREPVGPPIRWTRRGEPYVPVGQRIRGHRANEIYLFRCWSGLTRWQLAKSMHVSEVAIYLWERGSGEPTEIFWRSFLRIRNNYRLKLRRLGKDLDSGPVMEEKR